MLLVDTNIFLAGADRRSDRHGDCAWLLRAHHGELATTVAVIAKISWLLLDRLGPASQADLLRMVTTGRLDVIELTDADWARCLELVERYADLSLDLMDASLVAGRRTPWGQDHRHLEPPGLHRHPAPTCRSVRTDPLTGLPARTADALPDRRLSWRPCGPPYGRVLGLPPGKLEQR